MIDVGHARLLRDLLFWNLSPNGRLYYLVANAMWYRIF